MKFITNNPIAEDVWVFGTSYEQLNFKKFILERCCEGMKNPTRLAEGPFAMLTILILLHNVIRYEKYFDPRNPRIIILQGRMETVFGIKVFQASELNSRTEKLLKHQEASALPIEGRRWQLHFTNVNDEDTMKDLVERVIQSRPSWGEKHLFGENVVAERDLMDPCTPCIPSQALCQLLLSDTKAEYLEFYKLTRLLHQYLENYCKPGGATFSKKHGEDIYYVRIKPQLESMLGGAAYISASQVDEIIRSQITLLRRSIRFRR